MRLYVLLLCPCRECQVKHWSKHKVACQLMAEGTEMLQKDLAVTPTEREADITDILD